MYLIETITNMFSTNRREEKLMSTMFIGVTEAAEILGTSESYAYKLIQKMNKQMREEGYKGPIIRGRVDRIYFYQQFYGTRDYERIDV